jgi:hypothetical protein
MARKKYTEAEAAKINALGGKYKVENGVLKIKVKLSARDIAEGLSPWATSFGKEPTAVTDALKETSTTYDQSVEEQTGDRQFVSGRKNTTDAEILRTPSYASDVLVEDYLMPPEGIDVYDIVTETNKSLEQSNSKIDFYRNMMLKDQER